MRPYGLNPTPGPDAADVSTEGRPSRYGRIRGKAEARRRAKRRARREGKAVCRTEGV